MPGNVLLAIWGRETDFGTLQAAARTRITVLATQGYYGRRKDMFRQELLYALKMLEEGHVKLADMRSSWGGAMGLTQFLPSEFYKHAVDFDGDGKKDIWTFGARCARVRRAATGRQGLAARHALGLRGARAAERRLHHRRSRGHAAARRMAQAGICARPTAASPTPAELAEPASLLLPEGIYGPAFLTLKNYYVIKEYNFSDLYVLFVGHLSDRIRDPRPFETPWSKNTQLRTAQVETHAAHADQARPLQGQDRRQGRHADALGARRLSEGQPAQGRLLADLSRARRHAEARGRQ